MRKYIFEAHSALKRVYGDGSYSDESFGRGDVSALATKLTYGVLENDIRLEYILSQCVDKKPRLDVQILLKIGAYALGELTDIPDYAIVSECVEVSKKLKDARGASGFVNAVLKRIAAHGYTLPDKSDPNYLSVALSKPKWFVDRLIAEYGEQEALSSLSERGSELEHIRVNSRLATVKDVAARLDEAGESYAFSDVGGINVRVCDAIKRMFASGAVTYQSPSSMLAVQALGIRDASEILDLCSAPGGKAVYMSELAPRGRVLACELHPFRLRQIEKYAERMRATNITPTLGDATKFDARLKDKFDFVLVDAPCSCFGTFKKHPDVFLRRGEAEISKLAAAQKIMLKNAAAYVKTGGALVYSTCTLFDEENGDVVRSLLADGKFALEHIDGFEGIDGGKYADNGGELKILPHGIYDGFYIAKLRRKK